MPQGARLDTRPQDKPVKERVSGSQRQREGGNENRAETRGRPGRGNKARARSEAEGRGATHGETARGARGAREGSKAHHHRQRATSRLAEHKTANTQPSQHRTRWAAGPRQARTHGQQPSTRWERAPPGSTRVGRPRPDGGGGKGCQRRRRGARVPGRWPWRKRAAGSGGQTLRRGLARPAAPRGGWPRPGVAVPPCGPPGVGIPPGVFAHSQALPTVCQPPHPPPDALTAAEPA